MQKLCSLPSTTWVCLKRRSLFQPCMSPAAPHPNPKYFLMQIGALLLLSAHHSERNTTAILWTQMQFAQCWLADGFSGSWHVPGEAGFPCCCDDGHSGPHSHDGQPDLPQLAVRAPVFVHINISLPLIIHLANFKGALQSQLAVLGFITFISCISLAELANDASLKHSPA